MSAVGAWPDSGDLGSPLLVGEKIPDGRKRQYGIDEMLQIYCGEFGAWQLRHFVLTTLAWALEAFHTMVMIFADREPDWRCVAGTRCEGLSSSSMCGLEPGTWEWVGGDRSSTVAEWGLVCGDKYKVGLVQALFFGGCMIGAGTFGHLSDSSIGRKGSLVIVCILNAVFGLATAFAPSYPIYTLLRLLTGFSTGGVGLCSFVLATEPIGPTKRGTAGMSTFYFFSGGIALLSGTAYLLSLAPPTSFLSTWRALYIASSLPSLIFLVFVLIPFVSESPRWFLVRGRRAEANAIMRSIARTNGRDLPKDVTLSLDNEQQDTTATEHDGLAASGSLIDVVKSPVTRARLFLAVAINFLCSVVYYGLSLNVVNLDTNVYLAVAINALAEMPAFGITAVFLDRFGRRPLAVATMWFSGVFCLAGAVATSFSGGEGAVRTACGVMGIFGMAGNYNLLFIYTAELFPTVVRNAALGCATQAAQMGAILAPFVVVAGGPAPFAVFAACGVVGGAHALYLPETLNRPLYDTMAGMEDGESDDRCSTFLAENNSNNNVNV